MSIDIDWDALTSGPEGAELAENIRAFVHEKFQEVPLPSFIRSVQVHSFDFGEPHIDHTSYSEVMSSTLTFFLKTNRLRVGINGEPNLFY